MYAIVAVFIVWAIVRGRRSAAGDGPASDNTWIVWGGVIVPVVILAVLAVVTVQATTRATQAGAERAADRGRRQAVVVAGHLPRHARSRPRTRSICPAGRPVEIGLDSDNVIHSFWVPELAGKVDMIPGQHNVLRFTPETPGTYVGECAEFCGLEHARMGFVVIVQTDTDFDRWLTRHELTPSPPDCGGGDRRRGRVHARSRAPGVTRSAAPARRERSAPTSPTSASAADDRRANRREHAVEPRRVDLRRAAASSRAP